jgi:hypothetical protein
MSLMNMGEDSFAGRDVGDQVVFVLGGDRAIR